MSTPFALSHTSPWRLHVRPNAINVRFCKTVLGRQSLLEGPSPALALLALHHQSFATGRALRPPRTNIKKLIKGD